MVKKTFISLKLDTKHETALKQNTFNVVVKF